MPAGDGRACVVTFESFHEDSGFDRPGFGEAFFAHERIDAVHLLCRDSAWFQDFELGEALAAIRAACADATRVLAYGSSMGGYAAIRFADAVGAHAVLALSPQYSVDPKRAPFETRWIEARRRIAFDPAIDGPIRCAARAAIVYDPTIAEDRAHADLIAADVPVTRLPLDHAGHPAGPFLAETGLLRPLVLDMLHGELDAAALSAAAGARREGSATWWSEQARDAPTPAVAADLARRAAALAPDSPAILDRLALALRDAGDFAGAIAAHHAAIARDPINDYRWGLSRTLFRAGDLSGALDVARMLQQSVPGVAGYHRWAAEIALARGDRARALVDMRAAIEAAPRHRGYRRHALWLRLRLAIDRLFGR